MRGEESPGDIEVIVLVVCTVCFLQLQDPLLALNHGPRLLQDAALKVILCLCHGLGPRFLLLLPQAPDALGLFMKEGLSRPRPQQPTSAALEAHQVRGFPEFLDENGWVRLRDD